MNAILNAINQYAADNKGNIAPLGITTTATIVGTGTGQLNLCTALVPTYLAALPVDPLTDSGQAITDCTVTGKSTNYTVLQSANNRITVSAPATEIPTVDITVTR